MQNKQISLQITIIGWLIIAFSLLSTVEMFKNIFNPRYNDLLSQHNESIYMVLLTILLCISLSLLAGIGILYKKNWGRILVFGSYPLTLVFFFATFGFNSLYLIPIVFYFVLLHTLTKEDVVRYFNGFIDPKINFIRNYNTTEDDNACEQDETQMLNNDQAICQEKITNDKKTRNRSIRKGVGDSKMKVYVTIPVKLTLHDVKNLSLAQAYQKNILTKIFGYIALIMLCIVLIAFIVKIASNPASVKTFSFVNVWEGLPLFVCLISIYMLPAFIKYRTYKIDLTNSNALQNFQRFELFEEGIKITSISGEYLLKWKDIYKVQELKPCFSIVCFSEQNFYHPQEVFLQCRATKNFQ